MTKIADNVVAEVVAEASKKMSDANYSAVLVGGFVQAQTPTAQFISAHERELGGAESIVNVIFHAALLAQCFQRAGGRSLRPMSYEDLDAASVGDTLATLARRQPSLSDFIVSNVENDEAKKLLALLALAMDGVS
ncbi:MAG: hypothetical protein H6709_04770 [Kofleriaceae bacterium]|nr:hypothetical protein [Myxococcales bacterium]MCB9561187.1 hypothetical protein [Kofleriaceae bacterium]MCB9571383.1 hypothetical protein [Kofleriaceae bacterium]